MAIMVMATPSIAQDVIASTQQTRVEEAKFLIQSGGYAAARQLLEQELESGNHSVEPYFLLGMIAVAERDQEAAIDWFRKALTIAPAATRIRLELARAHYLNRDFSDAFRQFQRARAGDPPPGVTRMIDGYLAAIRKQKSLSYRFGFALAPDSNINSATSAEETELFGLPFELDESARSQSGIGVDINAAFEFAPRLGESMRLRMGSSVLRRDYRGSEYDDLSVSTFVGPQLISGQWDASLLATARYRRFGGSAYGHGFGARLEALHYIGGRTAIGLALSLEDYESDRTSLRSGTIYSGVASVDRALSPASVGHLQIGVERSSLFAPDLSSWSTFASLGYLREMKRGFTVELNGLVARSRFDAVDPFFGEKRNDRLLAAQVAISNRRLSYRNFTPRISYSYSVRNSPLAVYDYAKSRIEIGLTTAY